jgi:hypothetical protein
VHDITNLEASGIPGVFVATSEFESAAIAQGTALRFDPPRVLVPHPVQDRTDEELISMADDALDEVIEALTLSRSATRDPRSAGTA